MVILGGVHFWNFLEQMYVAEVMSWWLAGWLIFVKFKDPFWPEQQLTKPMGCERNSTSELFDLCIFIQFSDHVNEVQLKYRREVGVTLVTTF